MRKSKINFIFKANLKIKDNKSNINKINNTKN